MRVKFSKMQGCGNDYIYFCQPAIFENTPELARRLSDRHFGIGADGLVFILPSETADFQMRMFNADGSEGSMCGNAARCIAKYVFERGLCNKSKINLETKSGMKILDLDVVENQVRTVTVNMGPPEFEPGRIPVLLTNNPIVNHPIKIGTEAFNITCLSMGNPHCVIFTDEISDRLVHELGPQLEKHEIFPNRTNVEFVKVVDKAELNVRVWERGSGETLACGTGAAAVCVAANLNNLTDRTVKIHLPGGDLTLEWRADNNVYKTGPAEFVFDGHIDLPEE